MSVLKKVLFPIAIALVVLTLFLTLYNLSLGETTKIELPSMSSLLQQITNIEMEPFLFNKMGSVIEKIPDAFHVKDLEVNESDSDFMVVLKNIGALFYNLFITIMQLFQISAILVDFVIFALKTILGLFGGITNLWSPAV